MALQLSERPARTVASSVCDLLRDAAERNAAATAIVSPNRRPLSYGRLVHQVEATVRTLAAAGVAPNDRVALVLPNGPEMAVAFLAVAAGATCAPLNPAYTEDEFEFYISDLNARALIVAAGLDSPVLAVARKRGLAVLDLVTATEAESARQTGMLMDEIDAHKRTDAALQKAKEVAEAANVAKTRYIAGISHEIRTPLNSIYGYAQLLERGTAAPSDNAIRVIRRSAEHLADLIDGILDISKIENGILRLNRDRVPLAEFLDLAGIRHFLRLVNLQRAAVASQNFVRDVRRRLHQIDVRLTFQSLLNDLHV